MKWSEDSHLPSHIVGHELAPLESLRPGRKKTSLLLMSEILHHQGWRLSHYLWGFNHPRWCRISSINSMMHVLKQRVSDFLHREYWATSNCFLKWITIYHPNNFHQKCQILRGYRHSKLSYCNVISQAIRTSAAISLWRQVSLTSDGIFKLL